MKMKISLAVFAIGAMMMVSDLHAVAEERLRFVFITPCRDEAFFGPVKKGMQDAADMLNVDVSFIGTKEVDIKAQVAMVRKAVADGCDGIALNIIDPTAFDNVVKETIEKGVPVVAFNCDDRSSPNARLSGVGQDYYQAGRTLGVRAGREIAPKSKVMITLHNEGISALDDRLRGIQDALKEKKLDWKVLVSGNDPRKAVQVISESLKADSAIKAVLCTGLTDTQAAGVVAEGLSPERKILVAGFDLSPEILKLVDRGIINFTIDQQPYTQGYYPVMQLALYCRYGIKPSDIDSGAAVVGKKDARRVMKLTERQYR